MKQMRVTVKIVKELWFFFSNPFRFEGVLFVFFFSLCFFPSFLGSFELHQLVLDGSANVRLIEAFGSTTRFAFAFNLSVLL